VSPVNAKDVLAKTEIEHVPSVVTIVLKRGLCYFLMVKIRGKKENIMENSHLETQFTAPENVYQTLIENIPHVIWVGNSQGDVTFLNKACPWF